MGGDDIDEVLGRCAQIDAIQEWCYTGKAAEETLVPLALIPKPPKNWDGEQEMQQIEQGKSIKSPIFLYFLSLFLAKKYKQKFFENEKSTITLLSLVNDLLLLRMITPLDVKPLADKFST